MKLAPRSKIILVVAALLLTIFAFSLAAAEEDLGLNFSLSIDPVTLTKPGTAKVTARLVNSGQKDIEVPLSLFDADDKLVTGFFDGGSLSKLKVGETRTWSGNYKVKQEQLDNGKLVFYIKYPMADDSGATSTITLPAEAAIDYVAESVSLLVERSFTPEIFRKGTEVKLTYNLKNAGNVRLDNITIQEHSSISTKAQTVTQLKPGESKTVTFTKKSSSTDLTSHPEIKYKVQGDTVLKRTNMGLLIIPIARPNLKMTLSASNTSVSIGDVVTLTATFVNDGNVSYTDVVAKDKLLGELFSGFEIPAKQTVTKSRDIQMNKTQTFQLEVTLKDNTGTTNTEKTNSLKVSAYDPAKLVRISLELTADRENISELPGEIYLKITATNNSNETQKNIRLTYRDKTMFTIPQLEPGQSASFEREFALSQAGQVKFEAKVEDYLKNIQTFESNTLQIGYVQKTVAPTLEPIVTLPPLVTYTPVPQSMANNGANGATSTLQATMIVLGVLFGASALLLAASTVTRKLKKADGSNKDGELLKRHSYIDESTYIDESGELSVQTEDNADYSEESYKKSEEAAEESLDETAGETEDKVEEPEKKA